MKKKKPFMIQFVIGIILIGVGWILQVDYYSAMLFAIGGGLAFCSIANTIRIAYWQNPKRQDVYERKKQEAFILALFRVEVWVLRMMFSLFIFQWAIGTIVYRILEKRI